MDRILVIGAHFDDTDLAAGGSCAKWSSQGKKVYKLVLTDNVTNFKAKNITVDYDSSNAENLKVCNILGIEAVKFAPEKCNNLCYSASLMQRIEKIIIDLNIDTVIFHSDGDFNQDHNAAFMLCLTASRHVDNLLTYSSNGYLKSKSFEPNYFVDISNYVKTKKKALDCYGKSHDRFGRLFENAIERNHIWGYSIESEYAEGFFAIKLKV